MKTIAFYLPQFHQVPENDAWWGEGYTEWTAVKAATPLFPGHDQPHVPLHRNYYDLLEKETMRWQESLARRFGIDGFCFYHYSFSNGKRILEKPAENLLRWKDIELPFCFCWANESWARSWTKLRVGNEWNIKVERSLKKTDSGVLLKQDYGAEADWRAHFEYLLPFFRDSRYIRIDGRPLFLIYHPNQIGCFPRMKAVWNTLAKERGLPELYFVGRDTEDLFCYEKRFVRDAFLGDTTNAGVSIVDYTVHSQRLLEHAAREGAETFLCAHTGYDDTPRRGELGLVTTGLDPEVFCHQMKVLYALTERRKNEVLFINAWNEWGEGMHLEPDERFGYGYLEAVKRAQREYQTLTDAELKELERRAKEHGTELYRVSAMRRGETMRLLDRWLSIRQQGQSLADALRKRGFSKVAIYGMGILGKHLLTELQGTELEVMYGVDRNQKRQQEIPCFAPEDTLPEADVLIVTLDREYGRIYETLRESFTGEILSLKELLEELENR